MAYHPTAAVPKRLDSIHDHILSAIPRKFESSADHGHGLFDRPIRLGTIGSLLSWHVSPAAGTAYEWRTTSPKGRI